jgi:hypothetical protein
MFFSRKAVKWVGLAVWLALPVFLLAMPADYFDYGAAVCPSKRFLNLECPGCGMTRAVQHAIHFDWESAWKLNRGIVLIIPALFILYIHVLGKMLHKDWIPWVKRLY